MSTSIAELLTLKEQILAADDLPRELVEVPEWGATVYMRTMTGAERDAFEESCEAAPFANVRARLVGRCMVDENGVRIFGDADLAKLGGKNAKVLDRLFVVASRLNGVGDADVKALEKN